MSDGPLQDDPRDSPLRKIDRIADRFEREWRNGAHPQIRAFLSQVPAELRSQLLVELVCVDLEYRLRNNFAASLDDYLREFPELQALPPAQRAELESHAQKRLKELTVVCAPQPSVEPAGIDCPDSIGRYTIAGRIGKGGQADILLSFHPELLVPVVLKLPLKSPCFDEAWRDQLVREGRTLAALGAHPNLVRVYDLGFHQDRPFLVLEHVQGSTLEQYAKVERLSARRAAELVATLASAVHAAHHRGIIHQDISPRNILIDAGGQPRLIDFGLAWFRTPWEADAERPSGGTPNYLSPEQADERIGAVGPQTDVFGLGAVLYFLLTGQPPIQAQTPQECILRAAEANFDATAVKKDGIPAPLAAICLKALARNPAERYASSAEMATALRRVARPPWWRAIAGFLALFLAAGAGGWLLGRPTTRPPTAAVETARPWLHVRVWRSKSEYAPLDQSLPLRTGDEVQVRAQLVAGLQVSLFSINGAGQLSLLEPETASTELIFPASSQTRRLGPPSGTEMLLICGRQGSVVSEEEMRKIWDEKSPWPALDATSRLLRLEPDRVVEEGERSRDFGATINRPESVAVARRLEELRERLKTICTTFEGVAFMHQ